MPSESRNKMLMMKGERISVPLTLRKMPHGENVASRMTAA